VAASEGGANCRRARAGRLLVSTGATLNHRAEQGFQA